MPEHIEQTSQSSLASLASFKGGVNRAVRDGQDEPDARMRLSVANATRRSSFDGFLNTFLGRDVDASGRAKSSSASSGASAAAGSSMKARDKESLKKSMDKTVESDEAEGGEAATDEEVAAAAEEAAVLIWNLIYGYGEGAALPGSAPDSLRQLANMLNSQASGGARPGLGLDLVQGAIETANASAEMNSAAILASVDELLEGMPRHVLDDALNKMSGKMGLPTSGFEGVLAMLKGQVVGVNTASGQSMLNMLSASANPALAANTALSAESAVEMDAPATLEEMLQKFVDEKSGNSEEFDTEEDAANEFVKWLKEDDKAKNIKGLDADLLKHGNDAATRLFGNSDNKNQAFSEILKNLENTLQPKSDGGQSQSQSQGQHQSAAFAQPLSQHPGQTATVQTAHTVSMSSMLEQMENIERLSEAMKMATKGGVNNITMQLAPAELGRLVLKVESKNGVVSAKLKVERREAAEQLGAGLGQLKESLKALGIELGDVEIEHEPPENATDFLAELEEEIENKETAKAIFA